MHNNIMAAGSRDRPLMLAIGRYAQWRSRFLRYIDKRPNGDALRKCILEGPYTPTTVIILAVPVTDNSLAVPERTTVETVLNMSPENKAHFESEKEAIHLILAGIGDEIYSTVDACKIAHEMWEAIERLQQGESLNIQDVKTNLFWEFGKFTSHDGETIESNYTRFYKLLNEMIRNNLTVVTMLVNVQFLQQLQPEWSRIAKNANPLALVTIAQPYQDPYYQTSKSLKLSAPTSNASLPTISHATTRHKGKKTAKPITPPSESASEKDSDPEQAQKDKEMQKILALIAKYFKKLYKPTSNNLRTFSNTKNKNVDTTSSYKNDNQSGQFGNQRIMTVVGARETIVETGDSNVIPDSPDMCDNDIQNDQNDVECDDERVALANLIANLKLDVDENKKIQKQLKKANTTLAHELTECKSILAETSRTLEESNSIRDSCLVALQNKQTELEKYKTFNDRTVDYEKLEHKLNETLGLLAQKDIDIKEGLKLKAYEILVVKEKHDELVKHSLLTKSHYEGHVKEKTKVITDLKLKEEKYIDKMISMEKQLKFLNEIVYKRNQSIQIIYMLAHKGPTFNGRPTFANPMYLKMAQSEKPCLYQIPNDQSDPTNRLVPDREETLTLEKES
ncbi:hypothetical protein Tco_0201069 [Tanacetum coccineum]